MLRRLDGASHQCTHKSYINENRFLFEARGLRHQTESKLMPALCLRHDVDGVLWQPNCVSGSSSCSKTSDAWLTHERSFLAFGYVQASKQEAKFRACSLDCSYVCVADSRKHVYVYKQDAELSAETLLRNRRTGQGVARVAKQFLITLESDAEIHGLFCHDEYLVVLLADACFFYRVNAARHSARIAP